MFSLVGRTVPLLLALVVAVLAAACSDTSASRDAAADRNVLDAVDASSDLVADSTAEDVGFDSATDAGTDGAVDAEVPYPEVAACSRMADVQVVLSPEVNVPLDVFETCRTVFPADAGPPCPIAAREPCTCVDGRSGTRYCRDDGYWEHCRCEVSDAGMDAPIGTDGPIPQITAPRLIAPQSGARATSQRPTFRWVLPSGAGRARVEVCADRSCTRMLMQQELIGSSWRPTERLSPGVAFWRVHSLDGEGHITWTSATWEVGIRHRDLPVDTSYGTLKDFNGDGFDDVAMRSSERRSRYVLRIYWGDSEGLDANRFLGLNPPYSDSGIGTDIDLGGFARNVAIGDVNGDGIADLAIAASLYQAPSATSTDGRVYIYYGTMGMTGFTCAQTLDPPTLGYSATYGNAISAGDFNGDGYADIAIGTNLRDDYLHLHLGGPGGVDRIPVDSMSGILYGMVFIGDVNADGYADIAARTANSPTDNQVVILYGNPNADLRFHVQGPLSPRFLNDEYGFEMAGSDYNADGYADAIISGWGHTDLYHGSATGLIRDVMLLTPPDTGSVTVSTRRSIFGGHISQTGDLNGDGELEFAIGALTAPMSREGRGLAFIYQTRERALPPLWTHVLAPQSSVSDFGVVQIPGDVNGDGFDDLVVGAPGLSNSSVPEVYIYHGAGFDWWCAPRLVLHAPSSMLGISIN